MSFIYLLVYLFSCQLKSLNIIDVALFNVYVKQTGLLTLLIISEIKLVLK